jgi:hypothetical protein
MRAVPRRERADGGQGRDVAGGLIVAAIGSAVVLPWVAGALLWSVSSWAWCISAELSKGI